MLVGMGRGRSLSECANKRQHFDDDGFVVVSETGQGSDDDYLAAEFLADFTNDRSRSIFTRLDFAAGEFPFERQMLMRGALRQKQGTVMLDECADDWNGTRLGHGRWLNRLAADSATFLTERGIFDMKTFLKVLLIMVVLLIAIKLSPVVFVAALAGLLVAAILGALGLSLLAGFAAVVIALVAALSPIWIPVLLVMGAISLIKKLNERPQPPMVAV